MIVFIAPTVTKNGHVKTYCFWKKDDLHRGGHPPTGAGGSSSIESSQQALTGSNTQVILMLLLRLAISAPVGATRSVTTTSTTTGSAAYASQSSGEGPPSTSGTSPWIFDSSASFHMTPDHTSLSSISPPSVPITVQTTDCSPLSVAGRGTLLSSSFHVPSISYVPKLTM